MNIKKLNGIRLALALIIGLMACISSTFIFATGVSASGNMSYPDGTNPTSGGAPTIKSNVYGNLLEEGDRLFIFYAKIPYADVPTAPVTDVFTWSLYDMTGGGDGVELHPPGSGIAFNDNGYGWNVYSFYFPASANVLWLPEQPYVLRLRGDANLSWTYMNGGVETDTSAPDWKYNINSQCYNNHTDMATSRTDLAKKVISIATDLDSKWQLAVSTYLIYQETNTTVLSMYGEGFFNQAIPYLQYLAPSLYEQQEQTVDYSRRAWGSNYTKAVGTDQWTGTWIETAREGNIALFGGSYDLTSIIILLFVCIALVFVNISISPGDYWSGFIDVAFILVVTARLGVYGLGFLALIDAVCIIYIGIKIWGITGNG